MKDLPLNQVLCGECREVMKAFPDDCIDLVVTSPPYWGLRDYGDDVVTVWGGNPQCEHNFSGIAPPPRKRTKNDIQDPNSVQASAHSVFDSIETKYCINCGAWQGQLGLEPHPQMFIEHLTEICEDIKRILKPSGSFWLNLGDTYYASGGYGSQYERFSPNKENPLPYRQNSRARSNWLKPKQLLGIPWRVAISLQEQGWVLRNCVIWHKPNHMPSSVKDRLTASYEFLFFFVKVRKYFFDLDPIRQPITTTPWSPKSTKEPYQHNNPRKGYEGKFKIQNAETLSSPRARLATRDKTSFRDSRGKNPGDIWHIPTSPFPAAHFATFPMKLIEPIIKAGCPQQVCKTCGKPRVKQWKTTPPEGGYDGVINIGGRDDGYMTRLGENIRADYEFLGYSDCGCGNGFFSGVVLDPFCGSGTTLRVARKLGRSFIGIDIKKEYCEMAERRVKRDRYKEIPENVVPLSDFQGNETSDVGVPPKSRLEE